MQSNKSVGYIFIVISIILALVIVGRLGDIYTIIVGIFRLFAGKMSDSDFGYLIGMLIYWTFHISATAISWLYGRKLIRKEGKATKN